MDTTIATALITGGVTSLGSVLGFIGTMAAQKKKSYDAHIQLQNEFQRSIENKLDKHREEYLTEIGRVNNLIRKNSDDITAMKAQDLLFQTEFNLKFKNLEEKVTKHNNIVERMQKAELDIAVLQNREKVSEHRLTDLENE